MRNTPRVPLENRISYRCLSVASRITRHLAPRWKSEFGLTVTSWRVMAVIGRYEPLSAMQVAERTSTDAFFVGRAIDKRQGGRKPLIGNVSETKPGQLVDQFAGDMPGGAHSLRAKGHLVRV